MWVCGFAATLVSCGPQSAESPFEPPDGVDTPAPTSGNGRFIIQVREELPSLVRRAGPQLEEQRTKRALLAAEPALVVVRTLDELPMLIIEGVDGPALERLRANPDVVAVYADTEYQLNDAASFAFVGQSAAFDAGVTGAGTAVAVLDTGADFTHPAFGSCAAPGGSCSIAVARDFATEDGQRDANGHGTNVSGIVVGLAPGTRVLALDVFGAGGTASSSDIITAIDWVISQRAAYNVVALNLSLGGGLFTAACPTDVFAAPLGRARAAGIVPVVASGNNGSLNAISSPACAPQALSVGALYDGNFGTVNAGVCSDATTTAGKVACFSNSSAQLTMWAPGSFITAAGLTMSGTSQATPHVAGAVALLAQRFPGDSVDARQARLVSSAAPTIARNGVTRPRLWLPSALAGCSVSVSPAALTVAPNSGTATLTVAAGVGCAWSLAGVPTWATATPLSGTGSGTVKLFVTQNLGVARSATMTFPGGSFTLAQSADTTAPTGTLTAPALTKSATIAVTVSASDAIGVTQMCLSTDTGCPASGWVTYATGASVTLPAGDGAKVLRAWFRDARGNVSAAASATVRLDTAAPLDGSVTGTPAAGSLTVRWSGFSDATSGIAKYRLVGSASTTAPAPGCAGAVLYEGTATTFTVPGVANGATWSFRLCAVDALGTTSAGAITTLKGCTFDVQPRSATLGPAVGSATFTLTATAGCAWTVTGAPTWAPASPASGTGTATFKLNAAQNTGVARTATVTFPGGTFTLSQGADTVAPTGTFTTPALSRTAAIVVTSSASDALGVTQMCFSTATTCTSWVPYVTRATVTLPVGDGAKTLNGWFRDARGNVSARASAPVKLDTTAPTGGVLSGTTASGAMALLWSGFSDPTSGVAKYRVVSSTSATAPAAGCAGTALFEGTAQRFTVTGVPVGQTRAFRVCAVDAAGNTSPGATLSLVGK
jgi:hypothetical protein